MQDIKKADPDVIFSTINGDSNVNFYNELANQGIAADKAPVVAVSAVEDELRGLDPSKVKGQVLCEGSVEELENDPRVIEVYLGQDRQEYAPDRVATSEAARVPSSQ